MHIIEKNKIKIEDNIKTDIHVVQSQIEQIRIKVALAI